MAWGSAREVANPQPSLPFPLFEDEAKSLTNFAIAAALVLSRDFEKVLVKNYGIGSPEWLAASEMGIIRGRVVSSNVFDPSWDSQFAAWKNLS